MTMDRWIEILQTISLLFISLALIFIQAKLLRMGRMLEGIFIDTVVNLSMQDDVQNQNVFAESRGDMDMTQGTDSENSPSITGSPLKKATGATL